MQVFPTGTSNRDTAGQTNRPPSPIGQLASGTAWPTRMIVVDRATCGPLNPDRLPDLRRDGWRLGSRPPTDRIASVRAGGGGVHANAHPWLTSRCRSSSPAVRRSLGEVQVLPIHAEASERFPQLSDKSVWSPMMRWMVLLISPGMWPLLGATL
jgi:hypothetical protein